MIGTWYRHAVHGSRRRRHISRPAFRRPIPWWHVDGRWFGDRCRGVRGGRGAGAPRRHRRRADARAARRATARVRLAVTGIVSTGGQEDDAILAPLAIAQQLSGSPRAVSPPAGERADQTRGRFFRARSAHDDAGGIRPLVLLAVHFLDLAPDAGATCPASRCGRSARSPKAKGRILTRVSALMWLVTLAALAGGGAGRGGHRRHHGARAPRGNRIDEGAGRAAHDGRRVLSGRAVAAGACWAARRVTRGTWPGAHCSANAFLASRRSCG